MRNRLCCNQEKSMPVTKAGTNRICRALLFAFGAAVCFFALVPRAAAGADAPQWMHSLAGATLPAYDEKTDAVLLYSERNVTVLSTDKIKIRVREAYRIVRPEGREHRSEEHTSELQSPCNVV